MEKAQFFSYAGFHFKLCSLELRELFAYVLNTDALFETVRKHLGEKEFVPIYTCNRFDICVFGAVNRDQISNLFYDLAVQAVQSRFNHIPECHKELKVHISESLRFAIDIEGVNLFFKVAASLDSLVLGETQILGQLKASYINAQNKGFAKKVSSEFFASCFKTAKRIRTQTDLFKHVISIGHIAAECVKKEFSDITSQKIVIFGAGEMALLTAKHLQYHGVKNLTIANRTIKKAQLLCDKLNLNKFCSIYSSEQGASERRVYQRGAHTQAMSNDAASSFPMSIEQAMDNLHNFDVCITACGGDELLITKSSLDKKNINSLNNFMLFIDISMPRKIETNLSDVRNVKLYNIDQLSLIVEKNKKARQKAVKQAEFIILEETQNFLQKRIKRENIKRFREFSSWLSDTIQMEIDKFLIKKNKKNDLKSSIVARAICKKVSTKFNKNLENRYENCDS